MLIGATVTGFVASRPWHAFDGELLLGFHARGHKPRACHAKARFLYLFSCFFFFVVVQGDGRISAAAALRVRRRSAKLLRLLLKLSVIAA